MEEQWMGIAEFPGYLVSDYGRIYSEKTGTMMSFSLNNTGTLKVNLMQDRVIQTRSVKVLVANAFLDPPQFDEETTPINLDGDPFNNHKDNLTWRPRWFAWKYSRQFHEPVPREYKLRIINLTTRTEYQSVMEAGVDEGVIWEYIYQSILTGRPVYPTGSVYTFA